MKEQTGFNLFDDAIEEEHRRRAEEKAAAMAKRGKEMKIKELKIRNFRNITEAEWSLLRDRNIFAGPNHAGKTNTLQAVYWLLSDTMMDGSSNFESMKPTDDTSKEVSVEAIFENGFTLKKSYREKWVKTKGTETKVMTGHETIYYINGIKKTATDAKREISKEFGVDAKAYGAKFDLLRAVIDPYYLSLKCPWKVLRSFIIDICGDVSPEEIMTTNPALEAISERLKRDSYDATETAKFYRQECGRIKSDIEVKTAQISGLEKILPPSDTDIAAATEAISRIDASIAAIKAGKEISAGSDIEKSLQEARLKLRESQARDAEKEAEENQAIRKHIDDLSQDRVKAIERLGSIQDEVRKDRETEADLASKERDLSFKLTNLNKKIQVLRDEYDKISEKIDEPAEEKKCPHCGYVLNAETIEAEKKKLQKDLEECEESGCSIAEEIKNLEFKISDVKKQQETAAEKTKKDEELYSAAHEDVMKMAADIAHERSKIVHLEPSAETVSARDNVARLEESLREFRVSVSVSQRDSMHQIEVLEAQKKQHRDVLDKEAAYRGAQSQIASIGKEIKHLNGSLTDCEQNLALALSYTEIRLRLFSSHIAAVFGPDLKIQMIRENIKEGSWDETCTPYILGKKTPFADGSGSEQITTGIFMIECIKRHLDLPDLPIIFDECDKLDTQRIKELETNAQIFTTKVDDINYRKVTLTNLGGN